MTMPKIGIKTPVTVRRVREAWFKVSQQELPLVCDDQAKVLEREIDWKGEGWYSLDDDGVYRKGQRKTISEIWLGFDCPLAERLETREAV